MVSIKEAAKTARQYMVDILDKVDEVRLEEVESRDGQWFITLSFIEDPRHYPRLGGEVHRAYKVLSIDKNTGEVTSMKIRTVQDA